MVFLIDVVAVGGDDDVVVVVVVLSFMMPHIMPLIERFGKLNESMLSFGGCCCYCC